MPGEDEEEKSQGSEQNVQNDSQQNEVKTSALPALVSAEESPGKPKENESYDGITSDPMSRSTPNNNDEGTATTNHSGVVATKHAFPDRSSNSDKRSGNQDDKKTTKLHFLNPGGPASSRHRAVEDEEEIEVVEGSIETNVGSTNTRQEPVTGNQPWRESEPGAFSVAPGALFQRNGDVVEEEIHLGSSSGDDDNSNNENNGILVTANLVDDEEQRRELESDMLAAAREQLMAEAAFASAVPAGDSDNDQESDRSCFGKQKNTLFFSLGFVLMLVVIVVVLVVVLVNNNDGNASNSTALTQDTDPMDPTSVVPSPATLAVTTSPPTLAPTISPLNINNDYCEDAITVTTDGTIYQGNFFNSTEDSVELIHTTVGGSSLNEVRGTGRWYTFIGNGLDVTVQYKGTGNGTYLVLTGTCAGESLSCCDTTAVNADGIWVERVSSIFKTNFNTRYWLWVYMERDTYDTQPLEADFPYEVALVSQASCEGATYVLPPIDISNVLSYGGVSEGLPACGSASAPIGNGIWYSIIGENKSYRLSTEDSINLDVQISVFQGDCEDVQCVAGNDNAQYSYDGHSLVQFIGLEGVKYLILLHGASAEVLGSFVLSVDDYVINDIPNGALDLNMTTTQTSLVVEGSTENSTDEVFQMGSIDCGAPTLAHAVWYRTQGTNRNMTVSAASALVCAKVYAEDSEGEPKCFPGAAMWSVCTPVTFFAEEGMPYFIVVESDLAGGFTLTLSAEDVK